MKKFLKTKGMGKEIRDKGKNKLHFIALYLLNIVYTHFSFIKYWQ